MAKTIPPHPRALPTQGRRPGGYVYLHIVLMENLIGRYLCKNETVHHINFIKGDNRLKNLEIMYEIDHRLLHQQRYKEYSEKYVRDKSAVHANKMIVRGRVKVELECVVCKNVFTIDKLKYNYITRTREKYYPLCTRQCSLIYTKNKNEIYENKGILREYRERV